MGKILSYKHGESSVAKVDPRLWDIVQRAVATVPYDAVIRSGAETRSTNGTNHNYGWAVDVTLFDPKTGDEIPDYQNGPAFAVYENYAQVARIYQQQKYPELDSTFRWGGYFSKDGAPTGYGAVDLMHLDINPNAKGAMGLGSWAAGASPALISAYPGATTNGGLGGANGARIVSSIKQQLRGWPTPPPSEIPNALSSSLPDDAMYGLTVDGKGLGLTQEELAQATGWGQGDQLFSPAGFGALSDPRTVAMLTPQQRLAAINAVITLPKDVFIPLPNLGTPPSATVDDFVPYQTLPPPPIAQLDQPAPGQTFAGQEGGNVITKPSAPTPAAPFTGSRPPITTVDTQPKPLTYEKGKTASGKEVDLGRVVLGSDGSPGAWNLNSKGVAVFVKNPPTVIDYLNAGGVVGDMAAAEVEKAKAAAGEAVTGAADAVKDKAGEIVGGVGGFLGDLLKPRAGVTTGDTGAQSPPTMMTMAPAPSISSKIILPLSTSKALDFPSLGITSAAKPPVISTPAAVVPYFGETMNIPPIPAAVAKPLPVVNTPMQDYLSGNVGYTPTGGALAGAAGVGGAVASTVLAAPVVAAPPVVMRPVVRDTSPIEAGDYTIRWGDTLASISARSGISVADLAAQNGIGNINSIAEGQRLRIGMQPKAVAPTGPLNRGKPVVKSASEIAGEKLRSQGYTVTGNNLGFVSNGRDGFSAGALIPTKVMANRIAKGY